MHILFPTFTRMPTSKVHGIQVSHMCEAFASEGIKVTLLTPKLTNEHEVYEFYGVKNNFSIKTLPSFGSIAWGRVGYILQMSTFSVSFFFYALFTKHHIIFSREELPLLLTRFLSSKRVWEIHNEKLNYLVKQVIKTSDIIISISPGLTEFCVKHGAKKNPVATVVNAVSSDRFNVTKNVSKLESREKVGLPLDKKLILYTGNLVEWKGVVCLAESTNYLSETELVVFVGRVDVEMKERLMSVGVLEKMLFIAEQPYEQIPYYQKSADILVLPTSGATQRARLFTSPIKLFEYMLSGVPIVATDIPSTRAILTDDIAWFATPDEAKSLAQTCLTVLDSKNTDTRIKQERMSSVVNEYSWRNRAKKILTFVTVN